MTYPPRKGDLPRDEIVAMAERAVTDNGGPPAARVFFKFTCVHCGERCTFNEPNRLFEWGECVRCGKSTRVDVAGFALHVTMAPDDIRTRES